MCLNLVDIDEVKPSAYTDLKPLLQAYTEILRTGVVKKPVIIDGETGVIVGGHEIYHAPQLLSARKIPVFKVDFSKMRTKSLQPSLKSPMKNAIIEAGLKGYKLPSKSLEPTLDVDFPKISVSLEELGVWRKPDREKMRYKYAEQFEEYFSKEIGI